MHKVFDGGGHRPVHHLQAGRDDARCNDGGHRIAGLAQVVKAGHDAARQLRLGHQLDRHFGGHGQHALAANHHAEQVVTGRIERGAAKLDGLALDGVALDLQHVVHCQTIFEAVHAARVFGHIAADGAGDLAGRIGRVVQPVGRCGFRDGQVAHAALHGGRARSHVNVEDLVELGQRQRHAQPMGHGAARQARTSPARDHGYGQRMTGFQHRLDLGVGFRQRHHQRALAVGGQAIALVSGGVFGVPQQGVGRQHLFQGCDHLGLAGAAFDRLGLQGARGCVHDRAPGSQTVAQGAAGRCEVIFSPL